MAKSYKVIVKAGNEQNQTIDVRQGAGDSGQPVRIKAQAGAKYQLQEGQRNHQNAPDFVKVRRQGKNLLITFEGETQPSLIIEDYYEVMPEGYNAVVGQAENGNFYEYIPEDPKASGLIPMLGDGAQAVSVALGGAEVSGAGAALGVLAFSPLLGLLGLGAAQRRWPVTTTTTRRLGKLQAMLAGVALRAHVVTTGSLEPRPSVVMRTSCRPLPTM